MVSENIKDISSTLAVEKSFKFKTEGLVLYKNLCIDIRLSELNPFIVNLSKLGQFSNVLFIEVIPKLLFEIIITEVKAEISLNI